MNIPFTLSHFAKLLTLYCYLDKNEEFYEIIKDYTELIQSDPFIKIGSCLNSNYNLSQEIFKNFKFEVISIFVIFYTILENKRVDTALFTKLVEFLTTNNYIYINLLKNALNKLDAGEQV